MRNANDERKEIAIDLIYHLQNTFSQKPPFKIFLRSATGCGKTWLIKLLTDIYERYGSVKSHYNAFITCVSTEKAAVPLDIVAVQTAIGINPHKFIPLTIEKIQHLNT